MILSETYIKYLRQGKHKKLLNIFNELNKKYFFKLKAKEVSNDLETDALVFIFTHSDVSIEKDMDYLAWFYYKAASLRSEALYRANSLLTSLTHVLSMNEKSRSKIKAIPLNELMEQIQDKSSTFNKNCNANNDTVQSIFARLDEKAKLIPLMKKLYDEVYFYKRHCEEALKECPAFNGHKKIELHEKNSPGFNSRNKYFRINKKHQAVCELENMLITKDKRPNLMEFDPQKFYNRLKNHHDTFKQHYDPAWQRVVLGLCIILTGLLPGILLLGLYTFRSRGSIRFWNTRGQAMENSCDDIRTEFKLSVDNPTA